MSKKIVCFGEIMLRLKTADQKRFFQDDVLEATFGGGEANVSVSLSNYGENAAFVTALPENDLGKAAAKSLMKFGVDVSNIKYTGGRLGVYYLEAGAAARPSKVIYDRDYSAFAMVNEDGFAWDDILSDADWFHVTGITPAISERTYRETVKAMKKAMELGVRVSVDLNYRAKLWNYGKRADEVMPELVKYANVIIGNEEDCQKALGIVSDANPEDGKINVEAYKEISERILSDYQNVDTVAITLRTSISATHNKWAACINDGNEFYVSREYDIDCIVDRVGGGDSFAGGLIYALHTGKSSREALEFAVAASCLKHTISGDYNLVTVEEVYNLMNSSGNGRIVR